MTNEYLNNKSFESTIDNFLTFKKYKSRYELIIRDYEETINRKIKRNRQYDVAALDEHKKRYDEMKANFEMSQDQLAANFYKLSRNIVQCFKFYNVDPDDAIQEGVFICFEKIGRFNPSKGKAFNYMTTCVLNHFRQLWRSARNYNELKKKYGDFLQSTKGYKQSKISPKDRKNNEKD